MKLALMPEEPTWWVWLLTVALLAAGLAGVPGAFLAAIALSAGQTAYFWLIHGSPRPIGVQIRLAYTLLLAVCLLPFMHWLYWLPTIGTAALLVFGYCLMARSLSLLPWNRQEPWSVDLLRRTFLTAPAGGHASQREACGGENGVCELESRIAARQPAANPVRARR